jgi:hypothetical protein
MGILAVAVFASSAVGLDGHARDLLVGMFDDVGAILQSFEGGPNDPRGPVNNQETLRRDARDREAATEKARQLANELGRLTNQSEDRVN